MNLQPIVIYCRGCGQEATLDELKLACPVCESLNTDMVDGEDMYLMTLEMD